MLRSFYLNDSLSEVLHKGFLLKIIARKHGSFWRWLDTFRVEYLSKISFQCIFKLKAGLQALFKDIAHLCGRSHSFVIKEIVSCALFCHHLSFQAFSQAIFSLFCLNNAMKILWGPLMLWIWTFQTGHQSICKYHIQIKGFFD